MLLKTRRLLLKQRSKQNFGSLGFGAVCFLLVKDLGTQLLEGVLVMLVVVGWWVVGWMVVVGSMVKPRGEASQQQKG